MTLSVQCVALASSPTCEKESEVRSEKDSEEEEEETYLGAAATPWTIHRCDVDHELRPRHALISLTHNFAVSHPSLIADLPRAEEGRRRPGLAASRRVLHAFVPAPPATGVRDRPPLHASGLQQQGGLVVRSPDNEGVVQESRDDSQGPLEGLPLAFAHPIVQLVLVMNRQGLLG